MSSSNVEEIYEKACHCNEKIIMDKCEQHIYNNLESLVQNKSLSNLSKSCLEKIIETKTKNAYESDFHILKLICQWHKMKNRNFIEQHLVKMINFDNFSSDQLEDFLKWEYSEIIGIDLRERLIQNLKTKVSLQLIAHNMLVSGSADKTVKIWNMDTGECVINITGHTHYVYSLQSLPNNRLASGSGDRTIKIWNLDTGQCVKSITGHTNIIYSLQLLANNRLASGSGDLTIKIWNLETGVCVKTLKGHTDFVWSLRSLTNNTLASGSEDKTVKIWNTDTGECVKTITGHTNGVLSLKLLTIPKLV